MYEVKWKLQYPTTGISMNKVYCYSLCNYDNMAVEQKPKQESAQEVDPGEENCTTIWPLDHKSGVLPLTYIPALSYLLVNNNFEIPMDTKLTWSRNVLQGSFQWDAIVTEGTTS